MIKTLNILTLRIVLFFSCFSFLTLFSYGQERKQITIDEIFAMANTESLDAFKAKSEYGAGYWEYRSFKAQLLPKVSINLQPINYNRSFIQRYDPNNNIDLFRQQQNLNTFAELSLSQNIMATGATVYANSTFNRLINYGDNTFESYNTSPIQIGINQPLMSFNPLKWVNKTATLKYEKIKKDFLFQEQIINLKALSIFFRWALYVNNVQIAKERKVNSYKLYSIGKKRYPLGSIEKDDLLNLELETFTANSRLVEAEQLLQEVISELELFANISNLSDFNPQLPEVLPNLAIDFEEAKGLMFKNNPEVLDTEIKRIYSERDLDKAMKDNRFDFSINASYGLNQQANDIKTSYNNFQDRQMLAINFSMPILDWGERSGNIKNAKLNKDLADIEIKQWINTINQQLAQKINNFHLQQDLVNIALKTREVSKESYEITEKRFLSGKIDLLRLLAARRALQTSSEDYIMSLQSYWKYFYEVQKLTLYNFIDQEPLGKDFERLLKEIEK